jgi:hypothetical protein
MMHGNKIKTIFFIETYKAIFCLSTCIQKVWRCWNKVSYVLLYVFLYTFILDTASSACIIRVAFVGCPSHTFWLNIYNSYFYRFIIYSFCFFLILYNLYFDTVPINAYQLSGTKISSPKKYSFNQNFRIGKTWKR